MFGLTAIQALCLVVAQASPPATVPEPPSFFVGRAVCQECHDPALSAAAGGNEAADCGLRSGPCTLETIPGHGASFDTLRKTEARSIAAISGIAEQPTDSRVCLACHSTAADEGLRWTAPTFHLADGVQCEACHGPGSRHVSLARARHQPASGVLSPSPTEVTEHAIRRGEREDCTSCHVDRPSHREVLERGFRLTPADRQYKTPVNLALSPDGARLYVVCEHSDSLIVVDTTARTVAAELPVGRRPQDVAVGPGGRRVYVTNRMSGTLTVLDAETLTVVRETAVGFEPHGVLVSGDGSHLVVLSTAEDAAVIVNAEDGGIRQRLVMGRGPWSIASASGGRRAVVTNVRPALSAFREPPQSEVTIIDLVHGTVVSRHAVTEANMLQGVASVPDSDVVIFTLVRTKNLVPMTRLAQGWVMTNGLGVLWPDGRVDQVLLDEPTSALADPMDVAVSPDGRFALVTGGGTNEVVVVDVRKLLDTLRATPEPERTEVLPNHLGISAQFVLKRIAVGANPRGVAFAPDGRFAYVANALDDTVTVIDTIGYSVAATIALGGPAEITELRRGERLFHSAENAFARQFSCRSCHPDGHINGLTFDIEADGIGMNPVDNRTLRSIFDTAPFKWEGTNPTLHRQCGPRLAVFFTRLHPYTPSELDALVRYTCTIEQPPNRHRPRDGLTPTQRRGKAIFERTTRHDGTPVPRQQQCAACHRGALLTNRQRVAVGTTMWFDASVDVDLGDLFQTDEFGELGSYFFIDAGVPSKSLDVSHLRNIVDSPPYLHNGAAATLEEIWTRFNMVGRHGATADLTRQELNDLIAYLKSL